LYNRLFSHASKIISFKMFARSVVRAARASARVTPAASFTKPAVASIARSFSASTKLREPVDELVVAREVPHTSYEAGKVQRSTIVVGEGEQLASEAVGKVTPLSRAVYNQMPPHMQKMTLMDKVVVVTGYVTRTSTFCFEKGNFG
jgi:hypothetical protein